MSTNIDMPRNKWKIIKNKFLKWNKLKLMLLVNLLKINLWVLISMIILFLINPTRLKEDLLKMLKELLN
jgi:hypothetical protein